MATLFIALMVLVAIAITVSMFSAIVDVSRKPIWAQKSVEQRLTMVVTKDSRVQQLPFVGQDRRASARQTNKVCRTG